jgi:hypothetical protein
VNGPRDAVQEQTLVAAHLIFRLAEGLHPADHHTDVGHARKGGASRGVMAGGNDVVVVEEVHVLADGERPS